MDGVVDGVVDGGVDGGVDGVVEEDGDAATTCCNNGFNARHGTVTVSDARNAR